LRRLASTSNCFPSAPFSSLQTSTRSAPPLPLSQLQSEASEEEGRRLGSYFVGLALVGKDTVLRFIIEYSSLRDFGPYVIIIGLFLYEDF